MQSTDKSIQTRQLQTERPGCTDMVTFLQSAEQYKRECQRSVALNVREPRVGIIEHALRKNPHVHPFK